MCKYFQDIVYLYNNLNEVLQGENKFSALFCPFAYSPSRTCRNDIWQRRTTGITLLDWLFRHWSHISRGMSLLTCNTDRQQNYPMEKGRVVEGVLSKLLMQSLTNDSRSMGVRFRGVPNQRSSVDLAHSGFLYP